MIKNNLKWRLKKLNMNNIITGMTILEQTPIKEYTTLSYIIAGLGISIMVLALIIFIKRMYPEMDVSSGDIRLKKLIRGYVIGAVVTLFTLIHFPWFYEETGRYKYECTLEDNISANYISDNFNIVSVEDGIWTITDK